jgi:cobyrinic acid a,c-diamide synthase
LRSPARNISGKKAFSSKSLIKLSIPRVVVAGLKGGSGKTTLSIGLIGALRRRGMEVAAFKKGPDYIDAGWLASAAGRPCYNLDPYLIGKEKIPASFATHIGDADCAVVEGNRGLFDGMDAAGSMATSVVARQLKAPVILIVDCTKTTRTLAAMLKGVEGFERGLRLGGFVLNQVAGKRHETVIRESIAKYLKTPVLGAIPRLRDLKMPERHMGLTPQQEHPEVDAAIEWATGIVEKHVDIDALLKAARSAPPIKVEQLAPTMTAPRRKMKPRVGVIVDSAFQFYYPENFTSLTQGGAEIIRINALTDKTLPPLDALYIGGGFPETHAIALSENRSFRKSLKEAAESGLPTYAECGGLIYLGKNLTVGKRKYPMAGVLPVSFELKRKPQAHGYTALKVTKANPFFKRGAELMGHEFHYSKVTDIDIKRPVALVFKMLRGEGISGGRDGLVYKNVLATYTHLHALGFPEWAKGILKAASKR